MTPELVNTAGFANRDLLGMDRWEKQGYGGTNEPAFTVLFPSLTTVGTATATLRTRVIGRSVEGQVQFSSSTSIASTAGTDYMALPINAAGLSGFGVMTNDTANTAVGTCHLDVTNSRLYLPTQAASGSVFNLYFTYEI